MSGHKNRFVLLLGFGLLFASCSRGESIVLTRESLTRAEPGQLRIERVEGQDVLYFSPRVGREFEVSNFDEAGLIDDEPFFLFSIPSATRKLLVVQSENARSFAVYDHLPPYTAFSPEHSILAVGEPIGSLSPVFDFIVVDLRTSRELIRRTLIFNDRDPADPDRPVFNFVEPIVAIGVHPRDGVYAELVATQANYLITEHYYVGGFEGLWSSGLGQIDHVDAERQETIVNLQADCWEIRTGEQTFSVERSIVRGRPIAAAFSRQGGALLVTEDPEFTLWVMNEERGPVSYNLIDHFPYYADGVTAVSAAAWNGNEVTLVIDTEEFNYDFVFNVKSESAESYLRTSEYDSSPL